MFENFKTDYGISLRYDSDLQTLHKTYLDSFYLDNSYYSRNKILSETLFEFFKGSEINIITQKYDSLYFNIEQRITFSELENILAYSFVYDYTKICVHDDLSYQYTSLVSLKYQFLLLKLEGKVIINQLFEKFHTNDRIANLITDTLVKYLGENPEKMTRQTFTRYIVNLIELIKPQNANLNGEKIEWPVEFLNLLERFMLSERCLSYITSVDSIIKDEKSNFQIRELESQKVSEHVHILVHQYLKNRCFIYYGSDHQIAKNILNGEIMFNEYHNIKRYLREIKEKHMYSSLFVDSLLSLFVAFKKNSIQLQ